MIANSLHPLPHTIHWQARAIYRNFTIDILPDRQSLNCSEGQDGESFLKWLNLRAIPWLRDEVQRVLLNSSDPKTLTLHEFKYELRASTNASYGYLYIEAIEHVMVECEPHYNSASKSNERVVEINGTKFVVDEGIVPVGTEGNVKACDIGPIS